MGYPVFDESMMEHRVFPEIPEVCLPKARLLHPPGSWRSLHIESKSSINSSLATAWCPGSGESLDQFYDSLFVKNLFFEVDSTSNWFSCKIAG